jgi:hypothetical protein
LSSNRHCRDAGTTRPFSGHDASREALSREYVIADVLVAPATHKGALPRKQNMRWRCGGAAFQDQSVETVRGRRRM